jgi:virginiamycin A acetyltransferase
VTGALKAAAHALATLLVVPALVSYYLRAHLYGRERALLASSQALGLLPGLFGQYIRRAFLARTLAHCSAFAVVEWGTLFSDADTRIDAHAYIGPNCHIGYAHIERDVLIASGVHIPSGGHIHGTSDPDVPLRNQPGTRECVRIGANSWIGAGAVIMADIGPATVVGAGSVVTRPIPGRVVAAGVPARVIRAR